MSDPTHTIHVFETLFIVKQYGEGYIQSHVTIPKAKKLNKKIFPVARTPPELPPNHYSLLPPQYNLSPNFHGNHSLRDL